MKRENISQRARDDHVWMSDSRFDYLEEEVKEGETFKMILNRMAIENKVDITVVGSHGRRGPKADPTVMGSAVQYMAV